MAHDHSPEIHRELVPAMSLEAIRQRLAGARGQEYWRSLEELAETESFQAFLHREFPQNASEWLDPVGRRAFLKLMGASLALAGLGACSANPAPTDEKIVPYVKAPEEVVPGKSLFFATAMPMGGYATGLLVESHEGRPTKVEGNPQHPASLGAADAFAQASVLGLYDPDRSQVIKRAGQIGSWSALLDEVGLALDSERGRQGAGIRILSETVTSPTLASQWRALLAAFPQAKWHQYEPAGRDNVRLGARLAFGEFVETQYRLENADVILALDSDFLTTGPGCLRHARDFTLRRRPQGQDARMNRLYAVEATPTNTGVMADHRLPVRAGEIETFARAVARGVGLPVEGASAPAAHAKWIAALARDLQQHRGSSLIVAGEQQPPVVHALAHAMNQALGNVGSTVVYTDPVEANPVDQNASLRELTQDMDAGKVSVLIILGGNPVFTAPADLKFADGLSRVRLRVRLGLYEDETSRLCHWHIPEAHYLESWGDARAHDGTVTILQPLIAPLYGGKSAHELLAALLGQSEQAGYEIVRQYWKGQYRGKDFELFWRTALHDGVVAGTALQPRAVTVKTATVPAAAQAGGGLEIVFRPDPTIWDGCFANNGWLQELPKPLTKLTWDNAALVSPATAERLGLASGDVVELQHADRIVRAPIWIMPGHAPDSVTVHFGHGRALAGRVGTGTGFNAYAIRTAASPWFAPDLTIKKTGDRLLLVSTQEHNSMEGRNLIRAGTLEEYQKHPEFAREMGEEPPPGLSLYPGFKYEGYAWGMAIDLNACTGCNACVVACQAENNSPIVGKDQVARGREMQWLRIDRYYQGGLDDPKILHQPVMCQHCENAPCETVCPVAATSHSAEGLNDMVYNRCVGTRYCSNNCPYKVRRFNFLAFQDFDTPSLKLMRNPNVTVRSRGVMEKCTYCVQRINAGKIEAEKQGRPVRDGEIQTACQQACPAQAIVFGNINDPESRVAKLKAGSRGYGLLADLNTRPRTTYLAKLRNPNPEIEKG
ncbi:MAG TPA: TAT-variant-translocated molybdopterin oxidoreductase [Candidatus Methylomirabilis sp.]|nr:TAT-variant-translocated molybdopterin oxidoreductase [Candidatus Methylomirabilis sp.]